jgi:hypothetical protein
MTPSAALAPGSHLLLIEGGLTVIAIAASFCWPQFGAFRSTWFSPIERAFSRLARRRGLAIAVVGFTELLLRLALLPWFPIPLPTIPDEFSFLLAADTFASGRLTNPTPAMWQHFESIQISMQPTYMSMYFPGYGLILAAGKVLLGNPWYGQLCDTALMCAAICWMLQAWLPPAWALLGGLLAVLRIGLFTYWINTYTGGGCVPGLGGALVLGALPRITRKASPRDCILLAVGIVLLALSRPYEGLLLSLPISIALGHWLFMGKNRPAPARLLRLAAVPVVLLIGAGSWMAYYNYRNFGSQLTMPYTLHRATYAVAPTFIWQSPRPEPNYRHKAMHDFYAVNELKEFNKFHSASAFVPGLLIKGARVLQFYAGLVLLPPLFMLRHILLNRRLRFLLVCCLVFIAGMIAEAVLLPYYLAPIMTAFFAIGLQCMRHLRQWRPEGKPVGCAMQRLLVTICIAAAALTIWQEVRHPGIVMAFSPAIPCYGECTGSLQQGLERYRVLRFLEQLPEKQLVIVRYSQSHDPMDEWIYNTPDIDSSKVIWAREMDAKSNAELIDYYKDRRVWLVQPDVGPVAATPYPLPQEPPTQSEPSHKPSLGGAR